MAAEEYKGSRSYKDALAGISTPPGSTSNKEGHNGPPVPWAGYQFAWQNLIARQNDDALLKLKTWDAEAAKSADNVGKLDNKL